MNTDERWGILPLEDCVLPAVKLYAGPVGELQEFAEKLAEQPTAIYGQNILAAVTKFTGLWERTPVQLGQEGCSIASAVCIGTRTWERLDLEVGFQNIGPYMYVFHMDWIKAELAYLRVEGEQYFRCYRVWMENPIFECPHGEKISIAENFGRTGLLTTEDDCLVSTLHFIDRCFDSEDDTLTDLRSFSPPDFQPLFRGEFGVYSI